MAGCCTKPKAQVDETKPKMTKKHDHIWIKKGKMTLMDIKK